MDGITLEAFDACPERELRAREHLRVHSAQAAGDVEHTARRRPPIEMLPPETPRRHLRPAEFVHVPIIAGAPVRERSAVTPDQPLADARGSSTNLRNEPRP